MTGAARPPAETTADASQAPASARASSYTRSHPLGIVAGGGGLPREIAEAVVAAGGAVQLVGLGGEVDGDIGHLPHAIVGWGQIGRLIATLKKAGCRDVLIIGHVRRPDIGRIRPDLGGPCRSCQRRHHPSQQ